MEVTLKDATPEELQRRYILSPEAPSRRSYPQGGEHLEYFFDLDGHRVGLIELFHNPEKRHITWKEFYPLCEQLTEDEVRTTPWVNNALIENVGMDYLRHELCDKHAVPEGLEGHGLGTLAHTLVTRHLCTLLLNSEMYTTSYFSKGSIAPKLVRLLQRAGVEEMAEAPCPLEKIRQTLTQNAKRIFGFEFQE